MSGGELGAVFRGLARDAGEAASKATESMAGLIEKTADIEDGNARAVLAADARAARRIRTAGQPPGSADEGTPGPPWPARSDMPGAARGRNLDVPHPRHYLTGVRSGRVDAKNTVILRGYDEAVRNDIRLIADGRAEWNQDAQRYQVNGRVYGIESTGRVYPDSGVGLAKLDRNEYEALKAITRAGGDPSAVTAFSRDPRFLQNPDAIATAKAIYDGTYTP